MTATLTERIFSRAAGRPVSAGELVEIPPDWLFTIDDTIGLILTYLRKHGIEKPADPDRLALFFDHYAPANNAVNATDQADGRAFVAAHGISRFFDVGQGISHQVAIERGIVRPGQIAINTDSHTTTLGAAGCLGIGVGAAEMAYAWATGRLWFRVPETLRIDLTGSLPPLVDAKDVMLHFLAAVGPGGASYKAIEYRGSAIAGLPMAARMTLANMGADLGAKLAVVPADAVTVAHYAALGVEVQAAADPPADGEAIALDLGRIEPLVRLPDGGGSKPAHSVGDVRIDQAFIGSCTNGRIEDLRAAAGVFNGRRVHSRVRAIVTPASHEVYRQALAEGVIGVLIDAGCIVTTPGCGPCAGLHLGVLAAGETCIASNSRNAPGRMGSPEARILLASPATVAASAVAGHVLDPRDLLPTIRTTQAV